ncbi:NAD(P) transhydrogenase, mitochondrial, partial [Symbiodinium microadriaticum]
VNPDMENFDVVLVMGANDVVNSAAQELEGCAIWGMPVIEAVWLKMGLPDQCSCPRAPREGLSSPLCRTYSRRLAVAGAGCLPRVRVIILDRPAQNYAEAFCATHAEREQGCCFQDIAARSL